MRCSKPRIPLPGQAVWGCPRGRNRSVQAGSRSARGFGIHQPLSQNCLYCQLRSENTVLPRFRLNWEQIKGACQEGYDLGMRYLILESGEDQYYTDMIMCNLLTNLEKQFPEVKFGLGFPGRAQQGLLPADVQGRSPGLPASLRNSGPPAFFQAPSPAQAPFPPKLTATTMPRRLAIPWMAGFLVGRPLRRRNIWPVP